MQTTITLNDVTKNPMIRSLIEQANLVMNSMGYTEHGQRHVSFVSKTAATILSSLQYPQRMIELAAIAGYVHEAGKANIIVVNKWDLVEKDGHTMNEFDKRIREQLKFLAYSPILYVSALTKKRIFKILELVDFVAEQHNYRVATSELNQVINEAILLNPLPGGGGKQIKIYYATQVKTAPPTFALFSNAPEEIHFSYLRYLENVVRKNFGFEGTPIRFLVRNRANKEE
jgi:GTP-binding protein